MVEYSSGTSRVLAKSVEIKISRNRFWGTPIPVWKSDNPKFPRIDVYGSLDEIEKDFGVRPVDLHRPSIDELIRPNPDDPSGESMMRRVEEVLDCWFESGAMPYAQQHYPFTNKEIIRVLVDTNFLVVRIPSVHSSLFDADSSETQHELVDWVVICCV